MDFKSLLLGKKKRQGRGKDLGKIYHFSLIRTTMFSKAIDQSIVKAGES